MEAEIALASDSEHTDRPSAQQGVRGVTTTRFKKTLR